MPRVYGCLGLVLAVLLLPALSAQEKKAADKDKNAPKDKKEALDKLVTGGEITGKLVHWQAEQRYFTLSVTTRYGVPNVGALTNIANMQAQLAQAARNRDAATIADLNRRILQEQNNAVTMKEESHSMEFQAGPDMKVRTVNPPPIFDDKGKLRKPTSKELAGFKGPDKKLPGYTAEVADIRQDAMVTVYLPKKKTTGTTRPAAAKPKTKDSDKSVEAKDIPGTRVEAVMLLIGETSKP